MSVPNSTWFRLSFLTFLDQSNGDLLYNEDCPCLLFLFRKLSVSVQHFLFAYGVPVSWCGVVSKTIGIIVRLAGRNGRLWCWGAKCALACEMEGWVGGSGGCHEGIGRGCGGARQDRAGIEAEWSLERAESLPS